MAKRVGLVGKDMNKLSSPEVAEMGGIAVLGGIIGGLLFYIGLNTFLLHQFSFNLQIFATMCTILIIAFVGLIDDLLGWKLGLSQWQKPLLTLPAALPMMAINAGTSSVGLPIIGNVDLGILYPLLLVPLGIVGASNGFNMLAGYNGLEAGMGAIIITSIGLISYLTGSSHVSMICAVTLAALLAFLIFNWYPAKIFPGNCFTYMIGSIIACTSILANVEKLAVIMFIPYFIEFLLKSRSKMKAENFGTIQPDGSIKMPYERLYSITHFIIYVMSKKKMQVYEYHITYALLFLEACFFIISILLYIDMNF